MNLGRTRIGDWMPKWGPAGTQYDFGAVDKVTPDIQIVTKELKVGTVGDVVLGKRIVSLTGTITIECREIDRTLLEKLCPWYVADADQIPLLPATRYKDLYDYAQLLTLHPTDRDSTVETYDADEDINILKAVPVFKPMDRDGVNDDKLVVTFEWFPNRAKLPGELEYGWIGPVPAP